MEVLEMRMTTDLAAALPQQIGFNFEELKAELTERLKPYNSLVVTEDAIKNAKDDRANLRKLSTALDNRRKEVEKQWDAPLETFKSQVQDLTKLIDQSVAAIDGQVKAFEVKEKAAKRKEVEAAYAEIVPENLRDIIPFERIMDQKWLNKTTTMKSVRAALEDKAKRVSVDMALIDGVNPKYMAAVRTMYIETLDITAALHHQDKLMEADARFQAQEEARRQRMAQAAAWQGRVPAAEEKPPVAVQEPVREPVRETVPQPTVTERLFPLKLEFQITQAQANALKQFLEDNHIKYQKI